MHSLNLNVMILDFKTIMYLYYCYILCIDDESYIWTQPTFGLYETFLLSLHAFPFSKFRYLYEEHILVICFTRKNKTKNKIVTVEKV